MTPPPPRCSGRARGRPVSERWKRVLLRMYANEGNATSQEIVAFTTAEGLSASSVWEQTYKYVKSGLLVRIARGVFKLAPKGAEIAEEVRREQDEAASPTKPLPL
jgi:hypothetical protein